MAILATGNSFSTGDNVTATTLNNAVNNATFATGAVDNATTQLSAGAIIVKDGGITPAKLSTGGPSWTSGGNFGIGVSPTNRLNVAVATAGVGSTIATFGSTASSRLLIKDEDATYGATIQSNAGLPLLIVAGSGGSGAALALGANGSEDIRVDSSGNVGIGTTGPTAKLHVAGAIAAEDLTISGTVLNAASLPTSAAGLASGDLWVDPAASYVVKRVP